MDFEYVAVLEESDVQLTDSEEGVGIIEPAVFSSEPKCRAEWTDSATKLLINLYNKLHGSVGKSRKFSTFIKLWEYISVEMSKIGYNFTSSQVKQKWDALVRSYKEVVKNNRQTSQKRKTCQYETELHNILQKKRNVFPEYLADGENNWNRNTLINNLEKTISLPVASTSKSSVNNDSVSEETSTTSLDDVQNTKEQRIFKKRKLCRSPLKKFSDMFEKHHRERMAATEKWRHEKLEFKKMKEENRHIERMLLLEIIRIKKE